MESIQIPNQRQESNPSSGPNGLTSEQLRKLPSFNRRRAELRAEGVRNLPVARGPMPETASHIPKGGVKSTTRVRPTILANDEHLPKCLVKSCDRKAHYSEGGSEVTVCATHRKAHHVRRYALLHSKHTCHCGTRATYKDGSQYPIYCYWHKTKTSETVFWFQRFSMHHRGQFVGSYVVPKSQAIGQGPHE